MWLITIGHALTHWYPGDILPAAAADRERAGADLRADRLDPDHAGAVAVRFPTFRAGSWSILVGRKGLLMALSLFWIGAPYLLMGFSHDYWLLLTCAALVGIGNNLWHPTAIPLLAQHFPDRRGLAVSIHGMGGNVGDAVAPFVAGALLAYLTWRQVVIVNVIPGIAMSVLLLVLLGNMQSSRAPARACRSARSATCCATSVRCSTTAC